MLTLSPDSTTARLARVKSTVAVVPPSYCLLLATAPLIVRFFAVMSALKPLGCDTVCRPAYREKGGN